MKVYLAVCWDYDGFDTSGRRVDVRIFSSREKAVEFKKLQENKLCDFIEIEEAEVE